MKFVGYDDVRQALVSGSGFSHAVEWGTSLGSYRPVYKVRSDLLHSSTIMGELIVNLHHDSGHIKYAELLVMALTELGMWLGNPLISRRPVIFKIEARSGIFKATGNSQVSLF